MRAPTMASSEPGVGMRPSTMVTAGRSFRAASVVPRTCTLATPSAPSFSRASTTTTSPTPMGLSPSFFTPGMLLMRPTWGSSTPLPSSASLPLRSTMATSARPELPSVFFTPAESISEDESTKTTRAMPKAVAAVVVRRTARLRRLYLRGIIMTVCSSPAQATRRSASVTRILMACQAGTSAAATPRPTARKKASTTISGGTRK